MRTPAEIARRVQILTGVVRQTVEDTLDYVLELEIKAEQYYLEEKEQKELAVITALSGQLNSRWIAPEGFGKKMHIDILKAMVLTYQRYNASQEIIDSTLVRLAELQRDDK